MATATKNVSKMDMLEEIQILNMSNIDTFFPRTYGVGDYKIPKNGGHLVERREVIAQCQRGNPSFVGLDGRGNNACLWIDDALTRIKVGFESEDGSVKQFIVTKDTIKELLSIQDNTEFEKALKEKILTVSDGFMLREYGKTNQMDKSEIISRFSRGETI